jgi:hypothetical protein
MRNEMDPISPGPAPRATGFGECLVGSNALGNLGFEEWVFHPGMLFNALAKWWGDQGKRNRPHEGLDLCFYRTKGREVRRLDERTKIPVMYGGEVVKIGNDFLGASVYVCHSIYNNHGDQLLTAYGHIKPDGGIYPGKVLREGDILGTIAEIRKRRREIFPHVHISLAWISKSLCYQQLDWERIGDPGVAVLLNPLEIIGCRYSILT